jgi:glucose-1-phosphate thymidylyltransferase
MSNMKGVVLAGGSGSRLLPLTACCNKHLLPVYNKPMIQYPIQNMIKCGIKDILVVTGTDDLQSVGATLDSLGLSANIIMADQPQHDGIASALLRAETFVGDDNCCVMLGDNIYQYDAAVPRRSFDEFLTHSPCERGALIMTAEVTAREASRFGSLFSTFHEPSMILEKPSVERVLLEKARVGSTYRAITGTYFYTPDVFDVCRGLRMSDRNEYEISDVNRHYLKSGCLEDYHIGGWWQDAGTFKTLLKAGVLVSQSGANISELS